MNEHSTQVRIFNLKPVVIHLVFEMEETIERIPMIKAEMEVGATISSVDDRFQLESNLKIHAFCYNHNRGNWEPLIELCTQDDVAYNPWELTIRVSAQ